MKFIKNCILIIAIVIISFLFINSIFTSCVIDVNEVTSYKIAKPILNILILIIFVISIYFIRKYTNIFSKINNKNIIKFGLLALFCCLCIALAFINLKPVADQRSILNIADTFRQGDFNGMNGYLKYYPNQYGIVLFLYFISFIFGIGNYKIIQFLNIICLCISILVIYKIIDLLFENKKISTISFISIVLFLPISFYITFVYGTIFGLCTSLISIYFELVFLQKNKKKYLIISVIFASIAILFKSNYIINLIGQIVLLFLYIIDKKKFKYLLFILIYILVYVLSSQLCNFTIKVISNEDLNKGVPKICWLVMGIQEGELANGWYNKYCENVYAKNNKDYNQTEKEAKEDFTQRTQYMLSNPKYTLKFFYKKISSEWNEPTFQSLWINGTMQLHNQDIQNNEKFVSFIYGYNLLAKIYYIYCKIIHLIILFGCLAYFVIVFKGIKIENLIFILIFLGGFIFHIFWEAKSQYTITYFILLIPYSIVGYKYLINIIENNIKKVKKDILIILQINYHKK